MRNQILAFALFAFTGIAIGQNAPAIEFEYDANGNRIRRFLSVEDDPNGGGGTQRIAPPATQVENHSPQNGITDATKLDVRAYPNPFEEILNIEVSNWETIHGPLEYQIIDPSGHVVKTGRIQQSLMSISLNELSKGTYSLSVFGGWSRKSFLITKYK